MMRRGPVRRTMRRRSIARAAVGTAVVVGTAGAVRHHQDQKYANQATQQQAEYEAQMQQAQMSQMPQQQYAAPAPAPAPAATDLSAQLNQLAQLHASGVLTDEEFAAAKQKIISGG